MSTKANQNGLNRISIVVVIVLVIGCALLRSQIQDGDNYLFNRLLIALSVHQKISVAANFYYELALTAIEVASAYMIGRNLSRVPRTIALAQLYVVSMLLQGLIYSSLSLSAKPLSSAFVVIAGLTAGYVLRRFKQRDDRFESQYYELMFRNRELQEARLMLVKQDEVERRMLAADLHDQVLNDLKAVKQELDNLSRVAPSEVSEKLQVLLDRSMTDVREVMDNLCPSTLEHLGLPAAIEDYSRRGAKRAGFRVRFKSTVEENELEKLTIVERSLIYRLAQETLTNVCKHAEASKVTVNISCENHLLLISILDDGKGLPADSSQSDSRGLRYMRLRADLIGARVSWSTGEESKGTAVQIRMDLANRNGHSNSDS